MKRLVLLLLTANPLLAAAPIDLFGDCQLNLRSTGEILIPEDEKAADLATLEFNDAMALPDTTARGNFS